MSLLKNWRFKKKKRNPSWMGFIFPYGAVFRTVPEMPESWTHIPLTELYWTMHIPLCSKFPLSISGEPHIWTPFRIFSSFFHSVDKPSRENFTFVHFPPPQTFWSVCALGIMTCHEVDVRILSFWKQPVRWNWPREAFIYPGWIFKSNPFHRHVCYKAFQGASHTAECWQKISIIRDLSQREKIHFKIMCQGSELNKNFTFLRKL